jgi:hypothetical protein
LGYGQYSHEAHVAMTRTRAQSGGEVFHQRRCHEAMDPNGVRFRESRDSEAHPNSLPVVFALDVSGSMGEIPKRLATETLPSFMKALLDAGVTDPQVLFMAVGCAIGDAAPLQVGQFESTERLMDQWLLNLYLEGGGAGGNESYELAMYFAARHTALDSVTRRGRRGYLFLTGDEPPNPSVSRTQVQRLMGDALADDIPIAQIIEETQQKYEPFFLIPDPGRAKAVERQWRDLLGDRVIVMTRPDDTSHVCAGLVSLLEGSAPSLDALLTRFEVAGLPRSRAVDVARALTPFAASIGRDGAPNPRGGPTRLPEGPGRSGIRR